jgi:hypothetical protein
MAVPGPRLPGELGKRTRMVRSYNWTVVFTTRVACQPADPDFDFRIGNIGNTEPSDVIPAHV